VLFECPVYIYILCLHKNQYNLIYKAFRIIVMIGIFIVVKTEIMYQRSDLHVKRIKLSESEFI